MKAPLGVRAVRVAGPAVAVGVLITTGALATWPNSAVEAAPATNSPVTPDSATSSAEKATQTASQAEAARVAQAARADRSRARVALSQADEKTVMIEEAAAHAAKRAKQEAAAAKKAAAAQRAKELQESIIGSRYTTAAVKIRTTPSKHAKSVDIVDSAKKLKVTETVEKGYRQVVVDGKARWVTNEYLSKKKPSKESAAGISSAACSKSSSIESGLVSNGVKVYRSICAAFPEVSSFGGRRGGDGGFHATGQAVDAMISDSAAGWRLAKWVRAHASELGVSEVIYSQQIWTVQRSGEGWRGMSDRGSATANHYDHVHVSVY